MELLLQFRYLSVLVFNLRLFLAENTLHALILVFECDNRLTSTLILIDKFAELLIRVLSILLHLTLNQQTFVFEVSDALLYELLSSVERGDLAGFGVEQAVVEIDKSLILHLAITAIACAEERIVLLR